MTLREWRQRKGYNCAQAARYLGLGLRRYMVLEHEGRRLRDLPVEPSDADPV